MRRWPNCSGVLHAIGVHVTVTADTASPTFAAEALFASLELPGPGDKNITLDLPTTQAWFGHESRLRLDPPTGPAAIRDEKLVHLIARGFAARDQLMVLTAEEHSVLPTTAYRHLERIARLAYLDPAIVRAVLGSTQSRHLSARALWRMASLPLLWGEPARSAALQRGLIPKRNNRSLFGAGRIWARNRAQR